MKSVSLYSSNNFGSSVSTSYWCLLQVLHLALSYLNDSFINISMLAYLFNLLEHSPLSLCLILHVFQVFCYTQTVLSLRNS